MAIFSAKCFATSQTFTPPNGDGTIVFDYEEHILRFQGYDAPSTVWDYDNITLLMNDGGVEAYAYNGSLNLRYWRC